MKDIRLLQMNLRDFKGVRHFSLEASGADASIYGDNAAGKTSLFDGFVWALFDKDSQNKKDFQIKTLDAEGRVLHGLSHEVEIVLSVNGKPVKLRKAFSEKWTKKRGSATSEFSGHTTDYFVDDVPVKANEYKDRVSDIVDEDIFKLLTNPAYFNEVLKWQDRRKILLEVCGDVTDGEVIASNRALADLPNILGTRSLEDHHKVIAAKRAEINKELEKIPVRIDEVRRGMPDIEGLDLKAIENTIAGLNLRIESKQNELNRVQTGGEVSVKEKQQRELESELLQIKNDVQAGAMDAVGAQRQIVSGLRTEVGELQTKIDDKRRVVANNEKAIADHKDTADRLRKRWTEVNAETFEHHHDANCPACGQSLPEDQMKAAHEKALATFNRDKSERLEQISAKGKAAAGEARTLEAANVNLLKDIADLEQRAWTKQNELQQAEAKLNALQGGMKNVEDDPRYIAKQQEIKVVQQEILKLRSANIGTLEQVRLDLVQLKNDLGLQEQRKALFAQKEAADQRIAELAEQEKVLAAEYERLERELYLSEEFIRTKVSMLEDKINSKFRLARFKLFQDQINGGVAECCETTYNGVPYSTGLNNGAKINVGLDIINTLAEHYGFTAPIFVDNAESVTKLIGTEGQQIRLIVSEHDKALRIEVENIAQEVAV
jgi:DNA repair exonuclease SbcCD ATPase subunit